MPRKNPKPMPGSARRRPVIYTRFSRFIIALGAAVLLSGSFSVWADVDRPTKFSNLGGIINTRHNLTQSSIGAGAVTMDQFRNDYGEVCVYCHTPHGANSALIAAPLWNRTFVSNTYTTYDTLNTPTLNGAVTQPGVNSLTCLSCHDGTVAVDSIVNMPGSGNYSVASQSGHNEAFLDTWTNPSGLQNFHLALDAVTKGNGCLACHDRGAGFVGAGATDFLAFALGTDLTNDHPVGINVPVALYNIDFNEPTGTQPGILFYDSDADNRPDANEVRFYDTGDGPEVECGSCHDPHGVAPGGFGGLINATFLRVSNGSSGVCLTCHIK